MQILLFLLGIGGNFAIFVRGDRAMDIDNCAYLFNANNTGIMVTTKIGKHTVEMHDTIGELPVVRFHKYQKLLLIDAGIGGDISALDQRLEKTRLFLAENKPEQAQKELENLRQCVFLLQSELTPSHRAFAALVTKIDGEPCEDLSDEGLAKVTQLLNDAPTQELTAQLDAVKKKIDAELMLYFPALFNDSDIKEYYDILRRRTFEILMGIADGKKDIEKAVEKLTTALIIYSHPKTFTGSEGVEVQFDRQFENLCLVLSEQLHVKPKEYTVLEFYNAFDFVREKARKAEIAQKGGKFAR